MTRRERLEAKLEKREEWAEGRRADATRRFDTADKSVEMIPFGQPILVGHHSEKRHRAALKRHDNNMRAGCESLDMAKHHEQNTLDNFRSITIGLLRLLAWSRGRRF